jgi:hypothetical protein
MKKALFILLAVAMLSSCMTTQTVVGNYRDTPGREYKYDSKKQIWLFYGLIPLGRANAATPADGSCKITTQYTFSDFLISAITAGVITTYTIKVEAKK